MPQILELSPQALNINQKDLKDDTVPYSSGLLALGDYRMFLASLIVDNTGGGAVGSVKLSMELYANNGTTLLGTIDLLTAIGTTVDRSELVTFGRGLTPAKQGNGTIGAAIGVLKVINFAKLVLTVVVESDGTTCIGSARLYAGN